MGSLKKMRLVAYTDEKFTSKFDEYVVMLNPEQLKLDSAVNYNEEQAPDSGAPSSKYRSTPGEKLSFDIVIDCSGIVDSQRTDMPTEIKQLQKVVYTYNGDIHRPNYVAIYWGQGLSFKGVLTGMDTSYTYFKPDGTAIRAKISLRFTSYVDAATAAKEEGKNSPDMTHLINVVDGDSLPQISQQVYNDPHLYVQLAAYNRLNKFRHLKAGSQITAPPLKQGGSV